MMKFPSTLKVFLRGLAPAALLLGFTAPAHLQAQTASAPSVEQDHVVSSQSLDQQLSNSSADRQKNIETLQSVIAMPEAQKAMRDSKIDPVQVQSAIPTLSDKDLSDLSARASQAQHDFAAGYIGPKLFTIIILVVILIIVVIVVH